MIQTIEVQYGARKEVIEVSLSMDLIMLRITGFQGQVETLFLSAKEGRQLQAALEASIQALEESQS